MAFSEKANLSPLPKTTKKTLGVLISKSSKKPKRSPPPHLPVDIICGILSRQHVKTLCKSRCVSKSWLAQISDANFRRSHRRRSKDKPLLLLTTFSPHSSTLNFYSFDTKGDLVSKTSNSQHTMSPPISGVLSCLELVCIHHDPEDGPQQVYICNPATGAVIMLPVEETSFEEGGEHIHNHVTFGCVPSTGEYKVLRIFFRWCVDYIELGAEVFALRVDSEGGCRAIGDGWRDVCEPPCCFRGDAAFVDGAIYFLPDYGIYEYSTSGVAQFDLGREEWSVIPLPAEKYLVPKDPLLLSLREIGGKLCLVDHGESPWKLLNMWLLQDMDKKGVWVMAYSVDLSPLASRCVSPLGITEDERVLVKGSGRRCWLTIQTTKGSKISTLRRSCLAKKQGSFTLRPPST